MAEGWRERLSLEVFISWSGNRSRALARRLTEWLPSIVPMARPFFSDEIAGGLLWSKALLANLENAKFGIICVTAENLHSQWLHFEVGSLWKRFGDDLPVCPLLLELQPSALTGPLTIFQAKVFSEVGVKAICRQLADLTHLSERQMLINFKAVWPQLRGDVYKDLASLHEGVGEYVTISSPLAESRVSRQSFVKGWVGDSSAEVWVVIRPVTDSRYWVQPPAVVAPDGKWTTRVCVGTAGQEDVDLRYQMRAVVNPEIVIHESLALDDWPVAEWSSPILEVVRK